MNALYESDVENFAIELLKKQGYAYLSLEEQTPERGNLSEVVLLDRLKTAIDNFNPEPMLHKIYATLLLLKLMRGVGKMNQLKTAG